MAYHVFGLISNLLSGCIWPGYPLPGRVSHSVYGIQLSTTEKGALRVKLQRHDLQPGVTDKLVNRGALPKNPHFKSILKIYSCLFNNFRASKDKLYFGNHDLRKLFFSPRIDGF